MGELDINQYWMLVELIPLYFLIGIGLTLLFKHSTDEDLSLFMSREEAMAPFSTFGGYWPSLPAAIAGILFGITIELIAIAYLYIGILLIPNFGPMQFRVTATLAVMIGASFAYWGYLVSQTFIRESLVYRGWI
ncbi:hypothetical protein HWV07_04310 [Natronomonas salina]|uniref:hypothetical protein n=1 Tax=Natronomonas salina TaxID=1710540 RepID=UPI0015B3C787|nr:hypothetical protein [Natronomonas salina]QLD88297.1 hypothetical protein HWV07_04310 [Natronomonas salina]